MIYLSKTSLDVEIVTAKSSEMNVLVPVGDGDYVSVSVVLPFRSCVLYLLLCIQVFPGSAHVCCLCVCLCICLCECECVCVSVFMCMSVCMSVSVSVFVCMSVCVCVYESVCLCV